jgi:RNA polymerase sigma factor (sigma-70 family)
MQQALLTDRELVQSYLDGSQAAFTKLLARHKNRIYTSIYLLVRNESLANDLFQETFFKVVECLHSGQYREQNSFLPWCLRIAYNLSIDYLRKRNKSPEVVYLDTYQMPNIPSDAQRAEQVIIHSQIHQQIRKLLDKLPPDFREVVILRHYAELSFREIAEITGTNVNTTIGRMRYAIKYLRRDIKSYEAIIL